MNKIKLNKQSRHLFELMHKVHENDLSEADQSELNKILKESEELRLIFLSMRDQHISLDERLRNRLISDHVLGFKETEQNESEPEKKDQKIFFRFLIILCLLSTGFLIGTCNQKETPHSDESNELNTPLDPFEHHIATISSSINTYNNRLKEGQDLKAGWLTVNKGKIILQMSSGMEISIQAPTKLKLINSSSIQLDSGKIHLKSAFGRKGFSVDTKYGKLNDQGAEFGIHIDSSIAASNCFTGELAFIQDDFIQIIHAGQNYSLKDRQFIDKEMYETADKVRAQVKKATAEKLASWRQYLHKLKYDPSTAFLYQFSPNSASPQELIQEVHRSELEPAHGKIIGASWEQGRFLGTHSLKFDSPNDRVKFFLNEKFDAMTYHMWVKFDHLTSNDHLGIFLSEKWHPHQITLQYVSIPKGSFFKVHSKDNFGHSSTFLKPEQILGKWLLISFTFDLVNEQVHLYLNGKNIDKTLNISSTPLQAPYIGWCDLMNWVPLNSQDIRNTPGQVDFLSIHRRAFSPKEILEFYEKSKTP